MGGSQTSIGKLEKWSTSKRVRIRPNKRATVASLLMEVKNGAIEQSISLFMIRFDMNYLCLDTLKERSATRKGYIYLAIFAAILGIIAIVFAFVQVTMCVMFFFCKD